MTVPTLQRPVPGLDKLLEIEAIVSSAAKQGQTPLSLAEIKRRMEAKSVRHQTVKDCLAVLTHYGRVHVGEKGVEYVVSTIPESWVRL